MISILLVDDSYEFLQAAGHFLATAPWTVVIGRAMSGQEALEQVSQIRPDLVLLDLVMPDMNGLEVTRSLKAQPDAPRVIILTLYDHDEYRLAAHDAGADGLVIKSDFGTQLLPLIYRLFNNTAASPMTY